MENTTKLSKSVKRFIRTQKAQIRHQFLDVKKQNEEITELYKRLSGGSQKVSQTPVVSKTPKEQVKSKKQKAKK